MTSSRRISGLAAVLVAVLLFVTLASSVESTQSEFKNASWQLIDSDSTPGSILIGTNTDTQNPAGSLPNVSSRWSSRVMDSQRNDTRWLDIDWNGSEPSGTNVQARALTADGFVDWGPFSSVSNTQLTSWKRTFTESYDYADYRTNYLGFTNVSFRGLGHDASDQDPSVWYPFEGITSDVKDFTGNGNTGSLDSAARQEGYTGKAAYFDGSSRFSASSTGTSLTNPDGTIWMEMWVNPTNLDSSRQTLIDKQEEFRLNLENNGEVWFRTYGNTSRESGTLPQDDWSHVAVKWDAGNSVTVYVDGTETTNREISDTSPNTGNTVYFGQTYQGDQSFTGYIDEFRAFRNESNVELLTDVTDFTSPVQEAGGTTTDIEREFVQAMIRPESTDSYTVDNIRVGSNTSYSSWSDNGERLDAPQRRYGLIQLNLSGTETDSPQIDEVRLDTSIPEISLDSPNDGEVTTSPADLEWTSTDQDGDTLSFDVTVASDSSFSNVVYEETTSVASVNVDGLAEGEYYWQVQANDGYTSIDSSTRSFIITDEIENVSITLEGNFDQVEADGQQVSTGTYTDLSYPYLAATDPSGVKGLISYGAFIEAEYRNEGSTEVIEMTQDFAGERMLLVANNGTTDDIQDREQEVTSRGLLEQPMASFTGRIPDQSLISAMLSYTDIDLLGNETISANGNTEVIIRNEGTENGRVQVRIAER